jgi:hypothetical protein
LCIGGACRADRTRAGRGLRGGIGGVGACGRPRSVRLGLGDMLETVDCKIVYEVLGNTVALEKIRLTVRIPDIQIANLWAFGG